MTENRRQISVGFLADMSRAGVWLFCLITGLTINPANANAVSDFKAAFGACVEYYKSEEATAFEGLETVAPLKRTCSSCTTLLGRFSVGDLRLLVNMTDQGRYAGLDCSLQQTAASHSDSEKDQIAAWLNDLVMQGTIGVIPPSERLYRGEVLRACAPSRPQLHILLNANAEGALVFSMFSGESTGTIDKRPVVYCEEE
ncbi:MAG: hypothetical protein AAGP08_14440 [Pseudomonadota bacterium]